MKMLMPPWQSNSECTHFQLCVLFTPVLSTFMLYILSTIAFSHLFNENEVANFSLVEPVYPYSHRWQSAPGSYLKQWDQIHGASRLVKKCRERVLS
jgi:hypothetical protein